LRNRLVWKLSAVSVNESLNSAYLSLGANIDPKKNLLAAINLLSQKLDLVSASSIWSSPPIGFDGPNFFNAAVHIQSLFSMPALKRDVLLKIEKELGRQRTTNKFAARPIDLDIIIFNDLEIEIDIWRYAYLAVPLAEIHPQYRNPRTGEKIIEFAESIKKETSFLKVSIKSERT
jgi:2-amino-4-hydroxy-6-hydroxymethyldihydropteridine diphosphokinase